MKIYKTWTDLKNIIKNKNLLMQYNQEDYRYIIFATEDNYIEYYTEIFIDYTNIEGIDISQNNLDKQDFEDNYKDISNKATAHPIKDTLFYAEQGHKVELFSHQTNLDNTQFTVMVSKIVSSGNKFFGTDVLFTSDNDGEVRITINGYPVGYHYYKARTPFAFERRIPFIVPAGNTLNIEFKPDVSGAKAGINFAGYEL